MTDKSHDPNQMTGAAMIVRALIDHGVQHVFGYPGGAVLPIYDEIFQQSEVEHILVLHRAGRLLRLVFPGVPRNGASHDQGAGRHLRVGVEHQELPRGDFLSPVSQAQALSEGHALDVESSVTLDVTIPGLSSCDGDEDCTPPETCQGVLTCG